MWLMPENEAFQPLDGTYATVLGKVTAVLRRLLWTSGGLGQLGAQPPHQMRVL
ncbi:hypothetical protein [Streptomyces europaeiscabiei]|uniref:hypothetical protein n=1 Tax=Streptomyces europaeiscabiei TaxID=146819 RepID=UPI0038F657BD